MGSIDAEVEIDMEISDDEQESSKRRAVAAPVVDVREVKHNSPAGQTSTDKNDSSRKRKRSSAVETSPSVRVQYHNLSRESRRKLQDLLRDWSLWQGYHGRHSSSESRDNLVESGEEQYYPALQVGPVDNSFSVSFWVDKPAKQARSKQSGGSGGIARANSQDLRDSEADVPLYDRVTPSLSTQEPRKDGYVELEREATRCFNCGSYSHALRDCQRQWNYEAINSARSNHASKRSFSSGPRTVSRYYESHPSNEEPDRAPWQLHQTGELGQSPSYLGKGAFRSSSGSEKKEEKKKKPRSTEDNEEGEIVDDVGSPCVEEELYIAFNADAISQADRTTADFSGTRGPYNSVSERMWRSPTPTYSPPSQIHPHYHHQRSFAYSPQSPPVYSPTPSPVLYGGMNTQRSRDERHPQRLWEERNLYYPENDSSPAGNGPSAPIPIPAAKKEDDDWELNFESSVYQSESSRSSVGAPGVAEHYTPPSTRHQALTVNTVAGFSPPDPSQLSPTGSGYGDSFRPSGVPQRSVQYQYLYHSTTQSRELSHSSEAWVKAQTALTTLQSDGAVTGG